MATSATGFDYEAIVKAFIEKGVVTEKLEDKKNILNSKFWSTLANYYEAKGKYEYIETDNSEVGYSLFSNKLKISSSLDREHAFLDQKFKKLQTVYTEMEAKSWKQKELFFNTMEELYKELKKLPHEFNNENMHGQINSDLKSMNLLEQEIVNSQREMEVVESAMENAEPIDIPNVKEVTDIIQKDSLEWYGNAMKVQGRLSEIRRNIEFLSKKTQDIKVKYDI